MKRFWLVLASVTLLAGAAASTFDTSNAAFRQKAAATSAAQSRGGVSAERATRHLEALTSDKLQGRRVGTPGEREAAQYIAAQFEKYGLKPAGTQGFLQPFSFISGVELAKQNRFEIKLAGGARALKIEEEYMPLAFSSATAATGELVYVGYGISAPELQYDSYAGTDVKGKIALIRRGSPDGDNPHGRFADYTSPGLEVQKKTINAREKGARAAIFISEEAVFAHDRFSRLRHDLNFLDAGIPAAIISSKAAESLLTAKDKAQETRDAAHQVLVAGQPVTVTLKTDVVQVEGKSTNVIGLLRGSDERLAGEYVVIGAHYDHLGLGGPESLAARPEGQIHHGADDNASGTAALLELARVFADQPRPRRSILFAGFGGEEIGLLGSAAYTKNSAVPLASTVAMLNMDMVGRLRDGSLFVGGAGTSPIWKPLLERLNGGAAAQFKLSLGDDGFGPSDHQSFYVRDIPVLFFFTGTHDDYHKPSDTADKINTEGLRQVAEFVREIAATVANEPERIAFTKVKTEARPTGGGFRVYLGTVPNYADQSDGMKLDGVRAGSPAERAGLQAGDIIVKLASVAIKNVYDYTYALGELKAGQEVDVVIRREGREMTLKITPGKRQ